MKKNLEDRVFTYSDYLKAKFGSKVYKVGLSIGKICPHREENGGCIFCHPETFTHDYVEEENPIEQQLQQGIENVRSYAGDVKFLAYFQDETSTADSIENLKKKYQAALEHPKMVGLTISTRSDYLNEEILELLSTFKVPVTIELGLQSIHNKSLEYLNRGHSFQQVDEAIALCGQYKIDVAVHLIIGIPNESENDILETIRYVTNNKFIKQVKFHNLIAYKGTILGKRFEQNDFSKMDLQTYIRLMGKIFQNLRGNICVQRIFTSNARKTKISLNAFEETKPIWRNKLRLYLLKNDIVQGEKTSIKFSKIKIDNLQI